MTIDVYTSAGSKKGTATLPAAMFDADVNTGLVHQFIVMQQSNRRSSIAHTKRRGEIAGSTKKLFRQKGTGRARRGSVRANVLRGGNKSFGPRNDSNYIKNMPRKMRRAALYSTLSLQAKEGKILGLESYPETIKTKDFHTLLTKLPVSIGRKLLFVVPQKHRGLALSARNVPGVKVLLAGYLNPEDVLTSHSIVFVGDAIKKAQEVFKAEEGRKVVNDEKLKVKSEERGKKSDESKKTNKPKTSKPANSSKKKEKTTSTSDNSKSA